MTLYTRWVIATVGAAVAAAARDVLIALSPSRTAITDAEYAAALAEIPDGPAKVAGISAGQVCAAETLDRRATDGLADAALPEYVPSGAPGDFPQAVSAHAIHFIAAGNVDPANRQPGSCASLNCGVKNGTLDNRIA